VSAGSWSCTLSGLAEGANGITVVAVDAVGGVTLRTASVDFEPSNGDVSRDGSVDLSDALLTLRYTVGAEEPGAAQRLRADVAPLVNGVPAPNGSVDVADALTILRKVVALVDF